MDSKRGITLVALIITVIVMLILAIITINIGTDVFKKSQKEDLITTMLLIQGKIKVIKEKKDFGDIENLNGIAIASNTDYTINEEIQNKLNSIENGEIYILTSEDLTQMGIEIETDTIKFYIVDYNNSEVYYSIGYTEEDNIYYSLSELYEEQG